MPLDPVIAQGFRGIELQNPMDAYARVQQIQSAQQQNALARYQLGAAQREESAQNALIEAYKTTFDPATGSYDINKLRGAVIGAGAGSRLPGIEKQMGELRTQQLAQTKAEAEAVTQKLAQSRALLDTIDPSDPSAPQRFMAWHEVNHTDPVLGPVLQRMGVTADQSRARIAQAASQGPAALADLIAQSREGQTKFAERFKPIIVAPGASVYRPGDKEALFTAPVAPAKATPAETEEIVMRLQDPSLPPPLRQALQSRLTMLTTRELKEPKEEKDDPRKVVAFRETDAAGNVTLLNKFGEVITPSAPVKGKPSATFEKTTAQRKQLALDLDRAIVELTDASKDGGLIDQSTGSGAGQLRDVAMRFVGSSSSGAIAGGELAPIADLVLKMVPRFEGPQSDKDTTSYEKAAGQLANTAMTNAERKAAAKVVIRLLKERKGQFVSPAMAAEGVGGGTTPAATPAASRPSLESILGPKTTPK